MSPFWPARSSPVPADSLTDTSCSQPARTFRSHEGPTALTAPEHTPPLDLSILGWDDSFHDTFAPYAAEHVAARVSRVDRGACDALAA